MDESSIKVKRTNIHFKILLKEINQDTHSYQVRGEPVMESSIELLEKLVEFKRIILVAKGDDMPTAVSIANVITEQMLKGNSEIESVKVDSDIPTSTGRLTSNIEIILVNRTGSTK